MDVIIFPLLKMVAVFGFLGWWTWRMWKVVSRVFEMESVHPSERGRKFKLEYDRIKRKLATHVIILALVTLTIVAGVARFNTDREREAMRTQTDTVTFDRHEPVEAPTKEQAAVQRELARSSEDQERLGSHQDYVDAQHKRSDDFFKQLQEN